MNDALQAVKNKKTRGYILRILKLSYPQAVGTNILDVCLIDAGLGTTPGKLIGHLKYLEDKGYVRIKDVELTQMAKSMHLVELTSIGIDIIEGTIVDPGVNIDD
jgi:DNA-binding transcriptional ArsR family regulator